jgi:hypothetical protein
MRGDPLRDERGVALVVGLFILLVLTVIGFSSISTTTFETSIAGNERVGTDAFYAAEAIVEVGYDQLPDTTEIPQTGTGDENRMKVGINSYGWSGTAQDKGNQQPLNFKGSHRATGYDQSYAFSRYLIQAAGESSGASKEVESMVRYGPYTAGTSYNN